MISLILEYKDAGTILWIYVAGFIIAILVAMCFHEYAHARMAYACGDDTAKVSGRMTLNPTAHIDTLGALAFLLVGFGWAKPVPINPARFKQYRKGIFLTGIAGVLMNFVICFFSIGLSVLFSKILTYSTIENKFVLYSIMFLAFTFRAIATVNFSLCLFNLLPVYPLDGYSVLASVTKGTNKFVNFLKNYGTIILLVLMLTSVLEIGMGYAVDYVLNPIFVFWYRIFGVM